MAVAKKTTVKKVAKTTVKKAVAKKTVAEKQSVVDNIYYVTLKINGEEYKAEGETLEDVISQLKPSFIKTPASFRIEKDGKQAERYLLVPAVKMLFRNKLSVVMFVKNLLFK